MIRWFVEAEFDINSLLWKELRAFVLEEKGLAMSGEDFEVKTPEGELVLKVNGGNRVPIPGVEAWKKIMDGQWMLLSCSRPKDFISTNGRLIHDIVFAQHPT